MCKKFLHNQSKNTVSRFKLKERFTDVSITSLPVIHSEDLLLLETVNEFKGVFKYDHQRSKFWQRLCESFANKI